MEKFTFGLGVAGLGMIVVFAGLVLLIGFITILGVAAKERKKPAPKTEQKAESAPPVQTAVAADGVSPEVIAAITAAIAAVWESPNGFVVRHVKRVSNAPAWKRAGRDEQTYSRY